jgi:DNA-binding transcriptional MocR family regulator
MNTAQTIKARIEDGTYRPGFCIPGNEKLSEELGVSVATVRTAKRNLVESGDLVYMGHDAPAYPFGPDGDMYVGCGYYVPAYFNYFPQATWERPNQIPRRAS